MEGQAEEGQSLEGNPTFAFFKVNDIFFPPKKHPASGCSPGSPRENKEKKEGGELARKGRREMVGTSGGTGALLFPFLFSPTAFSLAHHYATVPAIFSILCSFYF